jgi:hypothetical protein
MSIAKIVINSKDVDRSLEYEQWVDMACPLGRGHIYLFDDGSALLRESVSDKIKEITCSEAKQLVQVLESGSSFSFQALKRLFAVAGLTPRIIIEIETLLAAHRFSQIEISKPCEIGFRAVHSKGKELLLMTKKMSGG